MSSVNIVEEFDALAFRRALGNFATGVTVITAADSDGNKVGMTANSFNSVSLDPPLILWSIDKKSHSYGVFKSSGYFSVNVLASDQVALSNHFARPQEDKFSGIDWQTGAMGSPVLSHTAACFQCQLYDEVDAGDHFILIGKVVAFEDSGRPPLCYYQGSYSTVVNLPVLSGDNANDSQEVGKKLKDSTYYLMVMAVRAYQSSYQPVRRALNCSVVESSILMVLGDKIGQNFEGLQLSLTAPQIELKQALSTLDENGMLEEEGGIYTLTDKGQKKAREYWQLSESHLASTLKDFSDSQVDEFKDMLRSIIERCS